MARRDRTERIPRRAGAGPAVRRAPALAAAAVAAVAALAATGCAAPAAGGTPASPGAAQGGAPRPGDLVSAAGLSLRSYPGTQAWRITYRSTTSTGAPDTVSGAVIAPASATAATPIIGYAPGTLGLGDQCAQSGNLDIDTAGSKAGERVFIQRYTSLGYAVAITDYEGLGTPGPHPYMAGRSEGRALLDVVRAAARLPGSRLSPAAPVAVVGYSQGGLAAGWAAELAPTYAPELRLTGAAVGAPPADGYANVRYLDGTRYAGLVLAAVYGWDAAYPELDLERSLNAAGRTAFADLADDCVLDLIPPGPKWAGRRLSEYTTGNVLDRPDWRARMAEESLGHGTPTVPVLLYGSPTDDIVPFATVAALSDTWRRRGADVTFQAPAIGDHATTGLVMAPVVTGWITARLLGLPTAKG